MSKYFKIIYKRALGSATLSEKYESTRCFLRSLTTNQQLLKYAPKVGNQIIFTVQKYHKIHRKGFKLIDGRLNSPGAPVN